MDSWITPVSTEPELDDLREDDWPEDHHIWVKKYKDSGDTKKMNNLTYKTIMVADEENPEIQHVKTEYLWQDVPNAHAAVYVVRFEGENFEDPETCKKDAKGKPIKGTGQVFDLGDPADLQARFKKADRLPDQITALIRARIEARNADPLMMRGNESATSDDSGQLSTPNSDPTPLPAKTHGKTSAKNG